LQSLAVSTLLTTVVYLSSESATSCSPSWTSSSFLNCSLWEFKTYWTSCQLVRTHLRTSFISHTLSPLALAAKAVPTVWTLPRLRQFVASFSPWKNEFNPKPVHAIFVVDEVTMMVVSCQVLQFSHQYHSTHAQYSFIHHWWYIIIASDSVVRQHKLLCIWISP
jgi:hypothetical protein